MDRSAVLLYAAAGRLHHSGGTSASPGGHHKPGLAGQGWDSGTRPLDDASCERVLVDVLVAVTMCCP
jgi:hypothetical protein